MIHHEKTRTPSLTRKTFNRVVKNIITSTGFIALKIVLRGIRLTAITTAADKISNANPKTFLQTKEATM
jgi:hypothetical protein